MESLNPDCACSYCMRRNVVADLGFETYLSVDVHDDELLWEPSVATHSTCSSNSTHSTHSPDTSPAKWPHDAIDHAVSTPSYSSIWTSLDIDHADSILFYSICTSLDDDMAPDNASEVQRQCSNCEAADRTCVNTTESAECDPCHELGLDCSFTTESSPPNGREKRRKLNWSKCDFCRKAKQKCLPSDRVWPEKCERCIQRNLDCTEPRVNTNKRGPNKPKPQLSSRAASKNSTTREAVPRTQPNLVHLVRSGPSSLSSRGASETTSTNVGSTYLTDITEQSWWEPSHKLPWQSFYNYHPDSPENDTIDDELLLADLAFNGTKQLQPSIQAPPSRLPGLSSEPTRLRSSNSIPESARGLTPAGRTAAPSSVQLSTFQYQPLHDDLHFRILRLLPGHHGDPLEGQLLAVPAPGSPALNHTPYEALSYVWGEQDHNYLMLLDGYDFYLRSTNLYKALQRLRDPVNLISLWVDAICIDQHNASERNRIISIMPSIYNSASNVCIWLGEGDAEVENAFSFVSQLMDSSRFDTVVHSATGWASLSTMLGQKYFTRRWTVSDVVYARRASLHYGNLVMAWTDLADAVSLLELSELPSWQTFRLQASRGYKFVKVADSAVEKSSSGVLPLLLSLEDLVVLLDELVVNDPRDAIYSLLASAKDTSRQLLSGQIVNLGLLSPDYSKSPREVFMGFVLYSISRSPSLDLICRPWAPFSVADQLPSWILPSLGPAFSEELRIRLNPDSLVGLPGHKLYSASGSIQASCEVVVADSTLHAAGFILSTIRNIGPRATEGVILSEWLEMGRCTLTKGAEDAPEAFWKTLVAGRGSDGKNPPSYYGRAFRACLTQRSFSSGDINTGAIIAEGRQSMITSLLRRVQSVILNRRFVTLMGDDRFGLVPLQARKGDTIAILFGCSVPVVLRDRGDGTHQFLGECYIHGMMDGEAVEPAARKDVSKNGRFILR